MPAEWMSDERAQVFGEAVVGLGRVAQALPLEALQRWFVLERHAISKGGGVTGADPRLIDAMGQLAGQVEQVAFAMLHFDDVQEQIETERAQAAEPQAEPVAEQEQVTYGDRRDEPMPDDWLL